MAVLIVTQANAIENSASTIPCIYIKAKDLTDCDSGKVCTLNLVESCNAVLFDV